MRTDESSPEGGYNLALMKGKGWHASHSRGGEGDKVGKLLVNPIGRGWGRTERGNSTMKGQKWLSCEKGPRRVFCSETGRKRTTGGGAGGPNLLPYSSWEKKYRRGGGRATHSADEYFGGRKLKLQP